MSDYFKDQRRRAREKQAHLQGKARSMTSAELLRSLSWQQALSDHDAEIGQCSDSSGKADIIRAELRRRGVV